jgi:DNA-binding response OmpR family regulator
MVHTTCRICCGMIGAAHEIMTNILLVDDNPRGRTVIAGALERPSRTVEAATQDDAIACIARKLPDLVIADVAMPQMKGALLVERLRAVPATASIPIILMTSADCPVYRVRGFHIGTDDYVTRPVDLAELELRVETALRRARRPRGGPALGGDLARFGIATPLSMLETERRTGVLVIERPNDRGMLVMKNGHIVRGELSGHVCGTVVDCVCELLAWDSGRFSFDEQQVDDQDDAAPTAAILLEASRKMDELIPIDVSLASD